MLEQLRKNDYRCVLGSVYPHDLELRHVGLISFYVRERVFPGGFIILHDGAEDRARTVEVLQKTLPALIEAGYEVTTVSDLVGG